MQCGPGCHHLEDNDLEDKDLDMPHEGKELEMMMFEDVRTSVLNIAASWLAKKLVTVHTLTMLHTDLQDLFEGLSELFFSPHDDLSNWTEGDWKSFECKCEVVMDKWRTMLASSSSGLRRRIRSQWLSRTTRPRRSGGGQNTRDHQHTSLRITDSCLF